MTKNLPAHTQHAESVAKLATGVGTALAAIWFPPAALAQPVIDRLIERWVRRPERILIESVRANGTAILTEDQVESFVPMAYRYFEAAKSGEFEHNLIVLSVFISSEIREYQIEPANLINVARAIEGFSTTELIIFSKSYEFVIADKNPEWYMPVDFGTEIEIIEKLIEPTPLLHSMGENAKIGINQLTEALSFLASRGLLFQSAQLDMARPDSTVFSVTTQGQTLFNKAGRACANAGKHEY